ncbi:phage tail spike protein [Bacillus sp. CDB3]|uniref:phage tail spike protein n=1 Tax=Bacillus sp. CDB3 TaxID=360310 RepID=UPI0009D8C08F|nr:phage tail spike protein [Bacillus sp. CDB3]OQR57314.1 hypothetical protein CDB3_07535 [Bacillus sp. CDB3]
MRTPSGVLHVIDFKTSQIVSAIQPKDYWDDKRHWEIKNNIDTLEFKVFDNTKYASTLMQQNLVLKEVRDGRIVPYIVTEVEKDPDDRSVITYASGAWINLAKDDYIRPQKIEGKTVNEFMDIALVGTKWKRGKTEYAGFHSMTIDEFIDPLSFLKKIASLFELEIIYQVEVVGSQITGWYVDMVKKRGRETGKEVSLGKDLVGIKRIENSQNICTALIGFIKKEGGEVLTITDINKGMPYIVDSDAFQRWNEKGKHKFGFYTPETEEDITPERLLTLMKTELAKRVNTSVSYEVNAQSIGRVFGLAHELINEGDTIKIKDTGFTPKLYLEARVIAGDESFTDPTQDKYVFGDYREIIDPNEELRKLYNKILASLGNKANKELLEQLEKLSEEAKKESQQAVKESQAAKDISEQLKENIENNMVDIIEAKNPPTTGLKPNKTLWRDVSNGKPGILKIWTGTEWESVVPDVEEVKNELERTNDSLRSKISEIQMKDYVGALGSTNQFFNTEFKKKTVDANGNVTNEVASTDKWTITGVVSGATVTPVTDRRHDGYNSVRIVNTGIATNSLTGIIQSVGASQNSGDYVLSAWVYVVDKSLLDQGACVKLQFFNGSTALGYAQTEIKDLLVDGSWVLVSVTIKAPDVAITRLQGDIFVRRNGKVWISQPQLQQGKEASVYMPNPKDITNYKELVDLVADKMAKSEFDTATKNMWTQINQNTGEIDLRAKATEVYSKKDADNTFAYVVDMEAAINLTNQNINSRVKKGDVISQINQSAEEILIQAGRINLKGYVTAEHIKGQVLEGVTLKTTGGSEQRYIQINKQNIRLYDKNEIRGFLGFYDRSTDGGLQPTFILGRDSAQGSMNGSFALTQVTPRVNGVEDFDTSYATLGMVAYYNPTTNEFSRSSQITFYRDGGHMNISADGRLNLQSKNDVYIGTEGLAGTYGGRVYVSAASYAWVKANKEVYIESGNGNWIFSKTNKPNDQNAPRIKDDDMNADFRLAYVLMRSSHVSGYQGLLQIKNIDGSEFRDVECRNLTVNGNFYNKSTEEIKANIRDLSFDPLEKIMSLQTKSYNLKTDVEKLYQMREEKEEGAPPLTTNEIPLHYGFKAEDTDEVFKSEDGKAINLYGTLSITVAAMQKMENKYKSEMEQMNNKIEALETLVQKLINEK